MRAAVIGGGLAGLAAAERLVAAGAAVEVFDKGRGPGGRMSTRRAQTPVGEVRFDHGAQFFTARGAGFQLVVDKLVETGAVGVWDGVFVSDGAPDETRDVRYVGRPGMNGLIRALAEDLPHVEWGRRVEGIMGAPRRWMLAFEDGVQTGPYDIVLAATPAEQTAPLLSPIAPQMAADATSAYSAPCWAVMLAFDARVNVPFDVARWSDGPVAWMARNASKPDRAAAETWVLHGSADWSQTHLEETPDAAAEHLLATFSNLTQAPPPIYVGAHRWRFAKVETAVGDPFGWDAELGVGCCGDWRLGARVECAWMSGNALGQAVSLASARA